MADYSSSEIITMQNDAVRRVNEMQRIAKQRVGGTPPPMVEQASPAHITQPQCEPPRQQNANCGGIGQVSGLKLDAIGESFTGILDRLNLDNEKILLILLIIILVNEGADIMLVLALGYILLTG